MRMAWHQTPTNRAGLYGDLTRDQAAFLKQPGQGGTENSDDFTGLGKGGSGLHTEH